jgi:hypothetical protein
MTVQALVRSPSSMDDATAPIFDMSSMFLEITLLGEASIFSEGVLLWTLSYNISGSVLPDNASISLESARRKYDR